MTPFGDDGPWQHFKSSDLIHLDAGECQADRPLRLLRREAAINVPSECPDTWQR
jgi:hypothetical protein